PPFMRKPRRMVYPVGVTDPTIPFGDHGAPASLSIRLHAEGGAPGGLLAAGCAPPDGLGESVDDEGGLFVAEARDGAVRAVLGGRARRPDRWRRCRRWRSRLAWSAAGKAREHWRRWVVLSGGSR